MKIKNKIYLASKSPRRQELLQQIGIDFEVVTADIEETARENELAADFVLRMAQEKAQAGYQSIKIDARLPTLGADTVVVVDGEIFGKPLNQEDSFRMLSVLSGRTHEVYTSIAVVTAEGIISDTSKTIVTFKDLAETEIRSYIATGESSDKAGSYAVQGLAAVFISHINGSYYGVMGLPIFETAELLKQVDV